jgi:hypothetical protein
VVDRLVVVKRTIVHQQQLQTKWTSLAADGTGGHHILIKMIRDATETKGRKRFVLGRLETRWMESRMID